MKKLHFTFVLTLFISFCLLNNKAKANPGDSCSHPFILSLTGGSGTTLTIHDSVTWVSYTQDSANDGFEIVNPGDTSSGYIDSAIFFSGSCGSLSFLAEQFVPVYPQGGKISVFGDNLITGNTYLIKLLSRNLSHTSSFQIFLTRVSSGNYFGIDPSPCTNCPTSEPCSNLVPNGDFETNCNQHASLDGVVCIWPNQNYSSLSCWDNPNNELSPDYYTDYCNFCYYYYGEIAGVPYNIADNDVAGHNAPVLNHTNGGPTGGYAGIFAESYKSSYSQNIANGSCSCSPFDYKEYIQNKLLSPLANGTTYQITFWICLAPNSPNYVDPQYMGMYLSTYQPSNLQYCNAGNCESGPLVDGGGNVIGTHDASHLITAQSAGASTSALGQWVKVMQNYTPNESGEQYITIGNFFDYNSDMVSNTTGVPATSQYINPLSAYYYIDDVSIVPQELSINSSATSVPCYGTPVTLSANSGSFSTYSWSTGATTSSITFSATTATTYTLTVTNSGGCAFTATYTLPVINFTFNIPPATCASYGQSYFQPASSYTQSWVFPLQANIGATDATYCVSTWSTNLPSASFVSIQYTGDNTANLVIQDANGYDANFNWFMDNIYSSGFTVSCEVCCNYENTYGLVCCTQTVTVAGCCEGLENTYHPSECYLLSPDVQNSSTLNMSFLNTSSNNPSGGGHNDPSYSGYNTIVDSTSYSCNCWVFEGANSNNTSFCAQLGIDGTLKVDRNLVILNSDITMGSLSQIILSNGATLTIDNSHIHSCDNMWYGIYIPNGCNVVVRNGSVIEDASQAAIVSINGGGFNITNSTLNNNYIGIEAQAYAGSHPGYISSSQILDNLNYGNYPPYNGRVNPTFSGTRANLNSPLSSYSSPVGILIDSVGSITIGDPSQGQNLFENENLGIHCYNSSANIYNNKFSTINICNSCTHNGSYYGQCILVEGNKLATTNTVNIGKASYSSYANYFYSSPAGVYEQNNLNLNVEDNYFDNDYVGVWCWYNAKNKINITYNTMTNIHGSGLLPAGGVYSLFNPSGATTISSNTITCTQNSSLGVGAEETAPTQGTTYSIRNNHISGIYYGITTSGLKNGLIGGNIINTNHYLSSGSNAGIYLAWAVGTNIYDNTITGHSNGDGIKLDDTYGIGTTYSLSVTCNTTYTTNTGLYFSGPQASDYVDYNNMNTYNYGLYMNANGLFTTSIGSLTYGTTNIWNDNPTVSGAPYSTAATVNGNLFYEDFSPGIHHPTNYTGAQVIFSTSGADCFTCTSPCAMTYCCPVIKAHAAIHHTNNYPTYSTASHWLEEYELYSGVMEDDSAYFVSGVLDSTVNSFKDSVATANMGHIYSLLNTALADTNGISSTDIGTANSLLSSITSPDTVEATFKTVFQIYTNMLASGQSLPDSAQAATLRTIAQLCPFQYGPAVYTARVLILPVDSILYSSSCEMGPDTSGGHKPSRHSIPPSSAQNSTQLPNVNVYPNPANTLLNIEVSLQQGQSAHFVMYNDIGEKIEDIELQNSITVLPLSKLSSGIYLYRIIDNAGNLLKADKQTILH